MACETDGGQPAAGQAMLDLNGAMTDVYGVALAAYRGRMLATTPVILALFDGAGGRMLLYRPGCPAVEAPTVPIAYQYLKAVAHSTVAVYELAHHGDALSAGASGVLSGLAEANERALASVDELALDAGDARTAGTVLALNRDFFSRATAGRIAAPRDLAAYARECVPHVVRLMDRAAALQVSHWMTVVEQWRASLGASWTSVHAAVNTLYVTRQKNILFTVLAQFMGEGAIGERLLLFETPEFTTAPERMLDLLARIGADRELGGTFFGHPRVMDVEVLGDAARTAIRGEAGRRGMRPVLPTCAPYDSNQWPWSTDPTGGSAPCMLPALLARDPDEASGDSDDA
ncbi:hypothetical protein SAZ_00900 [Streptomyces noursei ZPM]|uniref:Uncharacterized protein n=1 Tax=Streptomyces noursei TaxID=1971 RepID=A0A401QSF0_STRNR|nr:hypothetical protein [Streptomyces noursei]AKA01253.1 hypothetical protein SAZ_00900 [Streptomyces noursei ZPM]EOT01145.1 hypothetical protein K530_25235 [Streptomyces noursei CCRC 11814]EXU91286.1 hypothetical protein P354_05490 [Streptomyces noursei PD-1]GCB88223.1 hypothetical protein SALB_00893 [Streptomyces noursei]